MVATVKIGVLGATGPAGSALGVRLAVAGHQVTLGSRSQERAEEVRAALVDKWPGRDLTGLHAGDNAAAAQADLVVVATPWDGAVPTVAPLTDALAGKVVVSMANALVRINKEFQPLVTPRGSIASEIAAALPRSLVAAAFHHVPAAELANLDDDVETDVMICSDHSEATAAVTDLVADIPGMRALDAGRLTSAMAIESMTAVLIGMNVRYRTRLSLRVSGLRGDGE